MDMDMDMDKKIGAILEQNRKISKVLIDISVVIKKFDASIKMLSKKSDINSFLINNILYEKFNLSQAEIKKLIKEAEEKHEKIQ